MKKILSPTLWLLVVSLLSAGFSSISGMRFWWAFLIVALAILINGWVATLEDDLPGGFNNPDGTNTPRYAIVTGWVFRGLAVVVVSLFVVIIGLNAFAS